MTLTHYHLSTNTKVYAGFISYQFQITLNIRLLRTRKPLAKRPYDSGYLKYVN